jgi:hypothetical protein
VEAPFATDLQAERAALAATVTSLHAEQESLQGDFQQLKQATADLAEQLVRLAPIVCLSLGARRTGALIVCVCVCLCCSRRLCGRRLRACRQTRRSWRPR